MNIFLSVVILLGVHLIPAYAEIHKLKDEKGNIVFTEKTETAQGKTRSGKQPSVTNPITKEAVAKWINHPSFKYLLLLFLSAMFVLYFQYKAGSIFLKMLLKLLFVGLFGAMVYSILLLHYGSILFPDRTAPTSIPAAVNELKRQIHAIEKSQKKQLESIQELTRSAQDATQPILEHESTTPSDEHRE